MLNSAFRTSVLVLAASLLSAPYAAAARPAAPVMRIQTNTFKVKVAAPTSTSVTIPYDQNVTNQCARRGESALATGIVSATHHLADASFGPTSVSAFVVGPEAASATSKLQVVCVRNARIRTVRSQKAQLHWGSGEARASIRCPAGFTALGNPFAQAFTPGVGGVYSIPGTNPRMWTARVTGLTKEMLATFQQASWAQPVYADATCAKVTRRLVVRKSFTLDEAARAQGTASCTGGRRVLGWGAELEPFRRYPVTTGGWSTPVVERAQIGATAMAFRFGPAAGAQPSAGNPMDAKVTVHIVCGTLRA